MLLLLITFIAIAVMIWALFFRSSSGPELTPDYAPVEDEKNAEEIPNDSGDKLESPDGGGSVSISYSTEVSINIKDETVNLYFANPGKSNQNMVVQLVIQDNILVQSGTLKPGNQVTRLNLLDGACIRNTGRQSLLHPELNTPSLMNLTVERVRASNR